jgi:hypothetical protein
MSTRERIVVVGVVALVAVELMLLYPRVGVWALPVAALVGLLAWLVISRERLNQPIELKCSFCGKTKEQVEKLIAGPGVYICSECVDLCNEILEEERAGPLAEEE